MRKLILIILAIAGTNFAGKEALFSQMRFNPSLSLYSDAKAYGVGDALTILIVEETKAYNAAGSSGTRATNLSGGLSAGSSASRIDGSLGINSGSDFEGKGKTSNDAKIRSRLSVLVDSVYANGNLRIKGKRTATINGETQTVEIEGIVRPTDISPDNAVYSYKVTNMSLKIIGEGSVSEMQEPGLITRFLRILF